MKLSIQRQQRYATAFPAHSLIINSATLSGSPTFSVSSDSPLERIFLPRLTSCAGLSLTGAFGQLMEISLPELVSVSGAMVISSSGITDLAFPKLESIAEGGSMNLSGCSLATTEIMALLEHLASLDWFSGASLDVSGGNGDLLYSLLDLNMTSGGTGYQVGDTFVSSGGTGTPAQLTVTAVDEGGAITSITITEPGSLLITGFPTIVPSTVGGGDAEITPTWGIAAVETLRSKGVTVSHNGTPA